MTEDQSPRPMTDRATAVQNAANIISTFCGRVGEGPIQACRHDHTADGQALVRMVEQYAYPEFLRRLLDDHDEEALAAAIARKIAELERRALTVPAR